MSKKVSKLIETTLRFLRKKDKYESEFNTEENTISDLNSESGFAEVEGNYSIAAESGARGVSYSDAYGCCASTTGFRGMSASMWGGSISGSTGISGISYTRAVSSIAASTGTDSLACGKGPYSIVCNTGFRGRALTEDKNSIAIASGFGGESVAANKKSVAIVSGYGAAAKGEIGSCLIFVDFETRKGNDNVKVISVVVDGDKIKANTYYALSDGKIIERKEIVRPARVFEGKENIDDPD